MRILSVLFLAALCGAPAQSAPPKLVIPAEIAAKPGKWVTVAPDTEAKTITYVSLDGLDPFPSSELIDKRKMIVFPTEEKRYRFVAVGSLNDEHAMAEFVIVVGAPPVVEPPPKPTDPPKPIPTSSLYFLIVRSDGPASPDFTRTMSLSAWSDLRKAGHSVKDKTLTEAASLGLKLDDGTALPCVVTLRESADGKTSAVVRKAIPLPTADAAILELPKAVK